MASMVIIPPNDMTAIPLSAEPLVHPLQIWDPRPNKMPPIPAISSLVLFVIFMPLSILKPIRLEMMPEKNAPITTPVISKNNQLFSGFPVCD